MDVVIICNGLGNQMSQYAFYLQKRKISKNVIFILDKNSKRDHNGFELDNVFHISYKNNLKKEIFHFIFRLLHAKKFPVFSQTIIKTLNILGFNLIEEPKNYSYNEDFMKPSKGIRFFYGGWHSEKYFYDIKDEILDAFVFKQPIDTDFLFLAKNIQNSNSVAIHVRRGDYMNDINFERFGSVCTLTYYEKAINKIKETVDNPSFFVFTNDSLWVRENELFDGMTIVDLFNGSSSWKDMLLMSKCQNNINSNSTFSWWGAWLNSQQKKNIIVPYYFINNVETEDFYPKGWVKIKSNENE